MPEAPISPTFLTGDVIHASDLNRLREGINYAYKRYPHAYARQAVNTTSLQTNTWTQIGFDTVEVDVDGSFDQSGAYTCHTAGWWQCNGNIAYPWQNPSTHDRGARFTINSAATVGAVLGWTAASIVHGSMIGQLVHLNLGDVLTLQGYQDTGANMNTILNYQAAFGRSETSFLSVALMVADQV